jgi:hypothetical protein
MIEFIDQFGTFLRAAQETQESLLTVSLDEGPHK